MLLLLQHRRPDGDLDTYHLKPGRRYHVGRGSGCEVRILDLKLSRRHAILEWLVESWQFRDLGSTNGCQVDAVPVASPVKLKPGMQITLGNSTLVVSRLLDPAREPPAEVRSLPGGTTEIQLEAAHTPPPQRIVSDPVDSAGANIRQPSDRQAAANERETDELAPQDESGPHAAERDSGLEPRSSQSSGRRSTTDANDPQRPYFLNLLGRHLGPLTKDQARDLKMRELRGDLTPADLIGLPEAPAAGVRKTARNERR